MGYKDYSQDLTEAVYDLISGISADVFIHQATENPSDPYVIIRPESGSGSPKNHSAFFSSFVIAVEVVKRFDVTVNSIEVNQLAGEISELLMPTPNSFGITTTANHQVTDISLQSSNTITDIDGDTKYITRIDRYEFLINQT